MYMYIYIYIYVCVHIFSSVCFVLYSVNSRSGHDRSQTFGPICVFFLWIKHVCWIPPRKTMQNHYEMTAKSQFWTRNV